MKKLKINFYDKNALIDSLNWHLDVDNRGCNEMLCLEPKEYWDDDFVIIPTSLYSFIYVKLDKNKEYPKKIYDIKLEMGKTNYSINVIITEYELKNNDTYFIYEFNYDIPDIYSDNHNYAKNLLWALNYGLEDNNKRKKELVNKISEIIGHKVSMINFVGEDKVYNVHLLFNYKKKIIIDDVIVDDLNNYLSSTSPANDDIYYTLYTFDTSSFYIVQKKYGWKIIRIYHVVFLEQDYKSKTKGNKYSNTIKIKITEYKIVDNARFIFDYICTIHNPTSTLFTDVLQRLIIEEKNKDIFDLHKKVLELTQDKQNESPLYKYY